MITVDSEPNSKVYLLMLDFAEPCETGSLNEMVVLDNIRETGNPVLLLIVAH